jgi:glycosyltransferase involved in cell wall biosynthesis
MACGAPVVASDTAPVREIISHPAMGRLVDFFDPAALARNVLETLAEPLGAQARAERARRHVQTFSHAAGLARYDELIAPTRRLAPGSALGRHRELA